MSGATACSLLLTTSGNQCATDGDCAARGGAFAGSRCLDSVCVPATATTDATTASDSTTDGTGASEVSVADATSDGATDAGADGGLRCLGHHPVPTPTVARATLTEWFHGFLDPSQPFTNISVRLCPNANDPSCTGVAATKTPDATGHVTFDIDLSTGPFTGYLAIDPVVASGDAGAGDASADGGGIDGGGSESIIPSRVYFAAVPIAGDTTDDWQLLTPSTFSTFTSLYSLAPFDPKYGATFLVTVDCDGASQAGLAGSVDSLNASSYSFYFVMNQPSSTAMQTDSNGQIGFMNLPTGARTFNVTFAASRAAYSTITMYSLPNTISYANVGPGFTP
jgi:hypothetical protein